MRGHEALIRLRLQGKKPAAAVWITGYIGGPGGYADWHKFVGATPEIEIGEQEPLWSLDLRCLHRLAVMVEAQTDARAVAIGRLCEDVGAEVLSAWSHEAQRPVYGRLSERWGSQA